MIAAYLAFFPIAVGMLRGLTSPRAEDVELFRALACGWWTTLIKLRLPPSVPFLIPAARLGAAAAVIGAIVAEISTGTRGGIGRSIIEYAQEATGDPANRTPRCSARPCSDWSPPAPSACSTSRSAATRRWRR